MDIRRIVLCIVPLALLALPISAQANAITKGEFVDKMTAGYAQRCESGRPTGAQDDAAGDCCMLSEMQAMGLQMSDRSEVIQFTPDGSGQMPAPFQAMLKPMVAKCGAKLVRHNLAGECASGALTQGMDATRQKQVCACVADKLALFDDITLMDDATAFYEAYLKRAREYKDGTAHAKKLEMPDNTLSRAIHGCVSQ
ncbi:MAG: hypothetical protein JO142_10770 [Burkholderiales bacterium]|nr:hypothetical protein [Burkholderiales bacterium]